MWGGARGFWRTSIAGRALAWEARGDRTKCAGRHSLTLRVGIGLPGAGVCAREYQHEVHSECSAHATSCDRVFWDGIRKYFSPRRSRRSQRINHKQMERCGEPGNNVAGNPKSEPGGGRQLAEQAIVATASNASVFELPHHISRGLCALCAAKMTADADVGRYPPMAARSIELQIFSPFRHHVSHHATSCFDSAGSGESCMLFCSAGTPIARRAVSF